MKKENNKITMLLQESKKIMCFFVIALFSVILINPLQTSSASFNYKDFDWDTFAAENKQHWDSYCHSYEGKDKEDCEDRILKSQKKFYKKFYKLLAEYESEGLYINDNIILETIFIDMTPSQFSDDGAEYTQEWESPTGVYVIDGEEVTSEDINDDYDNPDAAAYFADEKDTLKILLKNMIGYTTTCYGIYGNPTETELEDGSKRYSCDSGGTIVSIPKTIGSENKCADLISNYNYGFWEYYVSKWAHDYKLLTNKIVPFLKRNLTDPRFTECQNAGSTYPEKSKYVYNDDRHVETDRYFDFLSYNIYFDKKAHLQKRFEETILKPAGVKCMTEDLCGDESLEAAGKYQEYEAQIIEIRREIIDDIIGLLDNYGIHITYNYGNSPEFIQATEEEAIRKSYYWPIGSDETEVRGGITYADGEPASTDIISYYGLRTNQITGEEEMHYGIDIAGVEGTTNVVAVYSGEVVTVVNNCTKGDYDCNEGYGNMIILSHSNGDYTVYAHLASVDSSVSVGSSVQKGQLIGKVGATGRTNTSSLHYEVRVGGNDISYANDPSDTSSGSNPRPAPSQGDFSVHETSLTKEEFISKVRAYCNAGHCNSTFLNVFNTHLEEVYDVSIASNVNPELVIIRAINEGFSPGGSTHNYWGIRCYNGAGSGACASYSSLADGIRGFANTVKNYNTVSDMMKKYAYIGEYWYNKGSWSLGGCVYYPYIKDFMSSTRANQVAAICGGGPCDSKGNGSCVKTTDEDQTAYATWQVNKKMTPLRYNIFGL